MQIGENKNESQKLYNWSPDGLDSRRVMGVIRCVWTYLFQQRGMSAEWLVTVRLLISGCLMLGISLAWSREKTMAIFHDKKETVKLLFLLFLA